MKIPTSTIVVEPFDLGSDEYMECVIGLTEEFSARPQNIDLVDSVWLMHGIEGLINAPISEENRRKAGPMPFTPENVLLVERHVRNFLAIHPDDKVALRKLRLVMTYWAIQMEEAQKEALRSRARSRQRAKDRSISE